MQRFYWKNQRKDSPKSNTEKPSEVADLLTEMSQPNQQAVPTAHKNKGRRSVRRVITEFFSKLCPCIPRKMDGDDTNGPRDASSTGITSRTSLAPNIEPKTNSSSASFAQPISAKEQCQPASETNGNDKDLLVSADFKDSGFSASCSQPSSLASFALTPSKDSALSASCSQPPSLTSLALTPEDLALSTSYNQAPSPALLASTPEDWALSASCSQPPSSASLGLIETKDLAVPVLGNQPPCPVSLASTQTKDKVLCASFDQPPSAASVDSTPDDWWALSASCSQPPSSASLALIQTKDLTLPALGNQPPCPVSLASTPEDWWALSASCNQPSSPASLALTQTKDKILSTSFDQPPSPGSVDSTPDDWWAISVSCSKPPSLASLAFTQTKNKAISASFNQPPTPVSLASTPEDWWALSGPRSQPQPVASLASDQTKDSAFTHSRSSECTFSLQAFTAHNVIGQGGYGKVVLASHDATNKKVAIKIVKKRPMLQNNPSSALMELMVWKQIRDNRFITRLYGCFQTEEYLLYVMKYVSGGSIHNLILAQAPLSPVVIRMLISEIICGLQYLHGKGIMHRDIKPDNVLLDKYGHPKIADFGLAVKGMFHSRKIRGIAGTLNHMAPEILLEMPYGIEADYFSLGVMIYEMAVRRHPYCQPNMTKLQVKEAIMEQEYEFPQKMDPDLRDLIKRLLEIEPRRRWELIRDVRNHPFFRGVDWKDLEFGKAKPLDYTRPRLEIGNYDFELEDVISFEPSSPIPTEEQEIFSRFSFESQRLRMEMSSSES